MRHVDDTHEAKGDGQPQAHDQQNRGQAEAIEEIPHGVAHLQIAFDALHGAGDGGLHLRVLFPGAQVPQARQGRFSPGLPEEVNRLLAYLRRGVREAQFIDGFLQDGFDPRLGFLARELFPAR